MARGFKAFFGAGSLQKVEILRRPVGKCKCQSVRPLLEVSLFHLVINAEHGFESSNPLNEAFSQQSTKCNMTRRVPSPPSSSSLHGASRTSLSHADDKLGKYQEQRRQKILKLFLAVILLLLFASSGGGGSLTFLRRQSASAASNATSAAAVPPPPPAPVPTSLDKSTLHKIGLFLGLRTESPTSYPTAVPTTAKPTTATPTDTPTMTPTNSPIEVPTKVPTAAPTGIPTDAPTSSPLPLPTTAKPTIAKDDDDGSILRLTPNETIIDPLNNTIDSVTNPSSDENLSENGLPTFNYDPSSDSMCHPDANNTTDENTAAFCKDVTCMHHEKDVDDKLFVSLGEDASMDEDREGCKMLWFAAMHESDELCKAAARGQHAYNVDYSIALNSALTNAHDSLQPVLLLGRLGMENENSTEPKKFGMWAEQRGVKVIYVPRLSFQDNVNSHLLEHVINNEFGHLQGPFLRLDIPKFVKEHSLFDIPNVCKHHVLYTDVDVIFANRITQQDVTNLSKLMGQAIISYGREYSKFGHIFNTGVMVMNVERFEQELPKMLQQARDEKVYPKHDQKMINNYREANDALKEKFQLLPMHYNWKAYWGLEPSAFSQVKILHFHGPKLGRGLEVIAKCNLTAISLLPPAYKYHLLQGICCDRGRTAEWSIEAINLFKAPIDHLCDIADQS